MPSERSVTPATAGRRRSAAKSPSSEAQKSRTRCPRGGRRAPPSRAGTRRTLSGDPRRRGPRRRRLRRLPPRPEAPHLGGLRRRLRSPQGGRPRIPTRQHRALGRRVLITSEHEKEAPPRLAVGLDEGGRRPDSPLMPLRLAKKPSSAARVSSQRRTAAVVRHDGRPGGALELDGAHASEHLVQQPGTPLFVDVILQFVGAESVLVLAAAVVLIQVQSSDSTMRMKK